MHPQRIDTFGYLAIKCASLVAALATMFSLSFHTLSAKVHKKSSSFPCRGGPEVTFPSRKGRQKRVADTFM